MARWSHRRVDRIIVNSFTACGEELRAGASARKVRYVPSGIRSAPLVRLSRDQLGLPPGPIVLSLGQLHPFKGHHDLLRAWSEVASAHSDASLVLVGDGPERSSLESQARSLGGSVILAGFQPSPLPFLATCDVLVQPSLTEGMPSAVLEGMAYAKPVVASAVGGLLELVAGGETGLLVPPGEPEALARALTTLLSDPVRAARLGEAGRRRAEEHFSLAATVAATENVYRELVPVPR